MDANDVEITVDDGGRMIVPRGIVSQGRRTPGDHSRGGMKYNETRHKKIVEMIRAGNYRSTAAKAVGVTPSTLIEWLREGHMDSIDDVPYEESRYRRLFEEVDAAEAEFEAEQVSNIAQAGASGPQFWAASATLLERRFPEKFGKRETTVIEGGDKPVTVQAAALIFDAEKREIANELLKSIGRDSVSRDLGRARPSLPGGAGDDSEPEDG